MTDDAKLMIAAVEANPWDQTAQLVAADALHESGVPYDQAVIATARKALETRIEAFCQHANTVVAQYFQKAKYIAPPPTHRAEYISDKWCRIVRVETTGRVGSVYGFIALVDYETKTLGAVIRGGIYKAASYKRAAKHARGNVFDEDFEKAAGPWGVAYLR